MTLLLVRRFKQRIKSESARESHRKLEVENLSRLGGVGIFLGCIFGAVAVVAAIGNIDLFSDWTPVLVTMGLMFGLGFWDDLKPLGAKRKLVSQVLIATFAYAIGLRVEILSGFDQGEAIQLTSSVAFGFTVAWLVVIPNIINLIDGIDGLAGGVGVLIGITLAILTASSGNSAALALCLAFVAAQVGFLCFNFPPAKIYMGDGGAYFIGIFIAAVSLKSAQKGSIAAILLVVIIALGIPILDTALAIARRGIRGLPLFRADAKHIHHKLLDLGYSKRRVVGFLYALSALLSIAGLCVFWSHGLALPIVSATLFVVVLWLTTHLGIVKCWTTVHRQVSVAAKTRPQVQRSHRLGEFLMHELEHCTHDSEFWTLFDLIVTRIGFDDWTVKDSNSHPNRVVIRVGCNEPLCLTYPATACKDTNWSLLGECLYPAYVAAHQRWQDCSETPLSPRNTAQPTAVKTLEAVV